MARETHVKWTGVFIAITKRNATPKKHIGLIHEAPSFNGRTWACQAQDRGSTPLGAGWIGYYMKQFIRAIIGIVFSTIFVSIIVAGPYLKTEDLLAGILVILAYDVLHHRKNGN